MNEPDIAPLARRLAEENNVDWRRLHGSGDGGRIVERDVLTFLAKVMAGEEDLDPTPEPVPDGMQAWPDADVAAYRTAAAAPPIDRSVTATLDDDLFLFDDAPGAASEPDGGGEVPPVFDASPDGDGDGGDPDPEGEDAGILLVDDPDAGDAEALDEVEDDDVFSFDDVEATAARSTGDDSALPDLFESGAPAAESTDDDLFIGGEAAADDDAAAPERRHVLDLDDRRVSGDDAPLEAPHRRADDDVAPSVPDMDLDFVLEDEAAAVTPVVPRHALESVDVALVRHGQVWRRRVDDRAFRQAVSQVADVLGAPPSAVAVALLARAVHRVWPGAPAVDGWWWRDDGAQRRSIDTDGRIGDAVAALVAADSGAAGAAAPLVVADLSVIALDEAVLHLDAPLLALGRATGDGAWLTLSGDDVPREAVAALGSVAEALAAPIRLVV